MLMSQTHSYLQLMFLVDALAKSWITRNKVVKLLCASFYIEMKINNGSYNVTAMYHILGESNAVLCSAVHLS
jgi:hypothetical protein